MRTRNTILFSLAVLSFCMGANLQPQDYLFIATHRNPTQVVSDDKVAYVLTEGGVLLYDYRRQQWLDNIAPGLGVSNIAYNPDRNQLLMAARGGAILEYNPVFRRVSASSATFAGVPSGTPPADLVGLQLGNDYTFQTDTRGNTVRDRYNRRVGVNTATIFEYDHLWILTAGHGSFLGSMRRREAAPAWFGLYDSSVSAIYTNGKNVWFGAPNPAGALVRAKTDLTDWRMYAAQQGYDFIDGTIYDMLQWRDYLWIATAKGVVRQDMNSGEFRLFRRMQGSTDIAVYRLYVHQFGIADQHLSRGTRSLLQRSGFVGGHQSRAVCPAQGWLEIHQGCDQTGCAGSVGWECSHGGIQGFCFILGQCQSRISKGPRTSGANHDRGGQCIPNFI